MAGSGLNAPCAREISRLEGVVTGVGNQVGEAWSFVRRAKLIRECLLGCSPESAETNAKAPSPLGALAALESDIAGIHAAFDALGAELAQIEKNFGL